MCQCLEGEQVDWENLRSPEQQQGMKQMYKPMMTGLNMGATGYPSQINAPKTRGQEAAQRTMMDIGGWGYKPQRAQYQPVPPADIPNLLSLAENIEGKIQSGGGDVIYVDEKNPPPGPPGPPGPDPRPDPIEMMQMLMALGMGGSPYDPTNRMG